MHFSAKRALPLIVAALTLAGCSLLSSRKDIPAELRVGVNDGYPPLSFVEDGVVRGIEADFAQMLGEELGAPVKFAPMKIEALIPALNEDRIDIIMAGMSVTENRAASATFVEPYARVGQMALIRKQDYLKLRNPAALNWPTSRVGVKSGTTGAKYAQETLKTARIVEFPEVDDAIAALRAGEITYFVHDAPTIWRIAGTPLNPDPDLVGLYTPLTEEYLAWAVGKDATAFAERLNGIVIEWKKDGKVKAVLDRWVPVRKVAADPGEQP
jgi:polar amino acid transport system substrate-binding protein